MKFTEELKTEIKIILKNKTPREVYESMIEYGMIETPMPTDKTYISIDLQEYKRLVEDSIVLSALEGSGVDNWDWYDDAIDGIGDLEEEINAYVSNVYKNIS